MNKFNSENLYSFVKNQNFGFSETRLFTVVMLLGSSLFLAGCATKAGDVSSWPVTNAEVNEFSGEVVDILCELTGNCIDKCGEGKRQLGIKSQDIGTVLVSKNLTFYTGAAEELWPYCGQVVNVNGLFTEHQGVRFFQVQNVRPPGGEWQKATRYHQAWAERSGKSPSLASKWYKHDDTVKDTLERDGRLGLGLETDQEYFGN